MQNFKHPVLEKMDGFLRVSTASPGLKNKLLKKQKLMRGPLGPSI